MTQWTDSDLKDNVKTSLKVNNTDIFVIFLNSWKLHTAAKFYLRKATKSTLWKWGHILRGKKLTLKILPVLSAFDTLLNGVRSLNTVNIKSVGLTLGRLEPGLITLAHTLAGVAKVSDFF